MYSDSHKKKLRKNIKRKIKAYRNDIFNVNNAKDRLTILVLSAITIGFSGLTALVFAYSMLLPSVSSIQNYLGPASTEMFDINGDRLFTLSENEVRDVIPLEEIPTFTQQATIAIEDDRFYQHHGFDLGGLVKAVFSELGLGAPRGGSTITQQLVKNTFLTSERKITRKIKELILATRLERKFSKDEILEMYLNQIPYGGTSYGVEQASDRFFAKDAKDLTLAESAVLAALPQLPTYYSPYGDNKYSILTKQFTATEVDKRKIKTIFDLKDDEYKFGLLGKTYDLPNGNKIYLPGRVDNVLKRMLDLGYIKTEAEYRTAVAESNLIEFNQYRSSIKAHHFVFYIKSLLEEQFGTEIVESGGLRVYTSLDLKLQTKAEELIRQAAKNNEFRGAKNASLLSIDNATGHILAMVGSADYFNEDIDGNVNIVTAKRQPGSSFKPFVFAKMFLNGYGAGSVIWDVQTKFGPNTPKNYDGQFVGPITVRRALAQSRNIPAIKAYYIAEEEKGIIDTVSKMGITNLDPNYDYGYPLALGTGEVSQLQLTHAYTAFAQNGKQVPLTPILKVEDAKGNILFEAKKQPKAQQVIDAEAAFIINHILSDKANNLGPNLNLSDRPAAAKTGTSNERKTYLPLDTWTVGYTPQITTSVWSGNNKGPMNNNSSGYSNAAPTWKAFMDYVHQTKKLEIQEFKAPKGIEVVEVSKASGLLPNSNTPDNMRTKDLFPSYGIPKEVDSSFAVATVDVRNALLPNEYCPDEFVQKATFFTPKPIIDRFSNWQPSIYAWLTNNEREQEGNVFFKPVPRETSDLCKKSLAKNKPSLKIIRPSKFISLELGQQDVDVQVEAKNGVDRVEFYLDGKLQYTATEAPYSGKIRVTAAFIGGQIYEAKAKVIDKGGFSATDTFQVKIGAEFTDSEINKLKKEETAKPEPEVIDFGENFLPFEDNPIINPTQAPIEETGPVIDITPL